MYINIYNIKFQNSKVMRVIKTKHFPFGGYKAINLFGIVFTKGELSNRELNHGYRSGTGETGRGI